MKKLVLATFIVLLCISSYFTALASPRRVFDFAGLINEADKEELELEIKDLEDHIGMDFVVLTVDHKDGKSLEKYADDFYDYDNVLNKNKDGGLVMLVDMEERTVYISTTGKAIDYYNDKRIYNMTDGDDTLYGYLAEGNYKGAIERCISRVRNYYDEDVYASKPHLNFLEIIIALALPFVIAFSYVNSIKKKYSMEAEKKMAGNYRLAYRATSAFAFTVAADDLLDRRVTRTPIIVHSSGGSHGGGGSTTHMGGSGTIHGGGGGSRHF